MAGRQLDRLVDLFRRRRSSPTDSLRLSSSDLSDDDDRSRLRDWIEAAINGRGGEVAARRRAREIGVAFLELDATGQRRFFELLAEEYATDPDAVDHGIRQVLAAEPGERHRAEENLSAALRPRHSELLRRFVGLTGGLAFTIELREALLPIRNDSPGLRQLDDHLRDLLDGWFDVALLELEHLDWESPASLLEKLIEYEAVHAIESWDDLKSRLGPGRRCYAFCHPAMPGEPLIFVEVALTRGLAGNISDVLSRQTDRVDADAANTAIFYSISNCHPGLAGVSLGNLLIKQVAELLKTELPNIETFATLSPIPGFRAWIEREAPELVAELDAPAADERTSALEDRRDALVEMAARYLLHVKRANGGAADSVANFHLSNGASVERINWLGNPSDIGWQRSMGLMVNYRYDLTTIEANHDRYDADHTIAASDAVTRLATLPTDHVDPR